MNIVGIIISQAVMPWSTVGKDRLFAPPSEAIHHSLYFSTGVNWQTPCQLFQSFLTLKWPLIVGPKRLSWTTVNHSLTARLIIVSIRWNHIKHCLLRIQKLIQLCRHIQLYGDNKIQYHLLYSMWRHKTIHYKGCCTMLLIHCTKCVRIKDTNPYAF